MAWIKTIPIHQAEGELLDAIEAQMVKYPPEYAIPVESLADAQQSGPAIVMAHSLIPEALKHAFSTFGALMSPDLPLSRKQHEMIAATVSAVNTCHY